MLAPTTTWLGTTARAGVLRDDPSAAGSSEPESGTLAPSTGRVALAAH
jgi:hypothetical protein